MTRISILFTFCVLSIISCTSTKSTLRPSELKSIDTGNLKPFERKVVSRNVHWDQNAASKEKGQVAVMVCINPTGKVTYAEIIEEQTTINSDEIKKAYLKVAMGYMFESNPNAPQNECGLLTFTYNPMSVKG